MAAERNNYDLFGFDLRTIGKAWRDGWNELLAWPIMAWLSPQEPVRVLLPDGGEVLRLGASGVPAPASASARAVAVVLPQDSVLVRERILPPLAGTELRAAVELELAAITPFSPDQTVWGWRAQRQEKGVLVRLALASRSHVQAALGARLQALGATEAEVWASADEPVVLNGFGEHRRLDRLRRTRRNILALVACAYALVVGLVATPVLQARAKVFDAQVQYGLLESQVAGVVAARAELTSSNERIRTIRAFLDEHQDLPLLLEALTAALPDDASLTRLEVQGRQVRIVGQADNASQLMNVLGAPGSHFREVRAPSPISRTGNSTKESFVIDMVVATAEPPQ